MKCATIRCALITVGLLLASVSTSEAATPKVHNPGGPIYVRPGGTSYTWTYGTGWLPPNSGDTAPITQISYHEVNHIPAGATPGSEDLYLNLGKFQYSTDGGGSWSDYSVAAFVPNVNTFNTNFVSVAGKTWRFVHNDATKTTATNSIGYAYYVSGYAGSIGASDSILPDNAPTDIVSDKSAMFSDVTPGTTVATLTPADTGMTTGGHWAIDSQSVADLFTISFNTAAGNTATLKIGSGTVPAGGQTPTVTVRYYDPYQTDSSGNPIGGQGFAKTLPFTVMSETSRDLNFSDDLKVNTSTPNDQLSPAVATLSNGNFVVVWQSAGQGGEAASYNGIYGQIYDAVGTPVGGEFAITAAGNNIDETAPAVTALNNGRFAVAYVATPGANGMDIGYRIVEANGTVGGQLIANTTVADDQLQPAITTLTDGTFVIAWLTTDNSNFWNVSAQRCNAADGSKNGSELAVDTSGYDYSPGLAALTNGAYVVAWGDWFIGDVKAVVSTSPATVIDVTSDGAAWSWTTGAPLPRLAGLTGGGFVVAWDSYANDLTDWLQTDIFFRRYDNSGAPLSAAIQANSTSGSNLYWYWATVAPLTGGGFVLGWQSAPFNNSDLDLSGIFGRRFTAAGVAVDADDFEINQHRRGDQNSPMVTPLASDLFAAVWQDDTSDTDSAGIEGRVLLPSNNAPALGGTFTTAGTVSDNATIAPFSGVTVTDADGDNVSISITYTAANGTLSGTGITGSAGNYTVTAATPAAATSNLQGLVFTPTANQVAAGSTVVTIFVLTPNDGIANGIPDSTTRVTATSINDAPSFSAGATLAAVNEDTASPAGATATSLLNGNFSDADAGSSMAGIAVAADASATGVEGDWEYSTDGSTWYDIGAVSTSSALLLSGSAKLRFSPFTNYNGTPGALTLHAVDNSSATTFTSSATRQAFDTTTDGPTSKVSATGVSLATSVTAVNDDPAIASLPASVTVTEDVAGAVDLSAATLTDADSGSASITLTIIAGAGTLTASSGGGVIIGGSGSSSLTLIGTVSDLDTFLNNAANILYTGASNAAGPAVTTLILGANDGGNTGSGGGGNVNFGSVNVNITPVNDTPVITSNGSGATAATSVSENTTAVTTVTATDPDTSDTLTYTISGGADGGLFNINSGSGVLTFAAAPDFENPTDAGENNVYDVRVTSTDNGSGNLADSQDLAVTVTNVNEAPVITSNGGGASASVNAAENQTGLTTVTATDQDTTDTLTYSISGGADQALFTLNSSSGILAFASAPNYESPTDSGGNNVYDVQVAVTDNGSGNLADSQNIAVTVTNVNETPVITSNGGGVSATISINENQTAVTTVTATDQDSGDILTFSITGGADQPLFTLNSSTGALTLASAPDFENPTDVGEDNVYDVQVTVTDSGSGNLADSQDLAVTVTNANDAPTIISDGGGITASVSAAENQTAVTTIAATDQDSGDTLTYSISGGVDQPLFAINNFSGVLTFVSAPDYENPTDSGGNNIYDVQVTVTDSGSGNLADSQDLAVTVTSVNESPVITSNGGGASGTASVSENITAVTTVTATDPDSADILTYTISGGADGGLFNIDSGGGTLVFAAAPDFENPTDAGGDNVYDIRVTVTDSGSGNLADSQDLAVTVTNANDAPSITSDGGGATASVSAAENQTAVTTITATDQDASDTLTYSISGGVDQALFAIDDSGGSLAFASAPNFETPGDSGGDNVYNVQVTVTDSGTGSLTDAQDIAVTVTSVNETPTITSNGGGASGTVLVNENATGVTTVTAIDPDDDDTLTYTISGGADSGLFHIGAGSGALTFATAPDFEDPTDAGSNNVYDVRVTVNDSGNLTASQNLAVTVNNINECPEFTGTPRIDGDAKVTRTVRLADTETVDPENDPVTLTYQWQVNGVDITGATASEYTITIDDLNKLLSCTITADDNNEGTATMTTDGKLVRKGFPWLILLPSLVSPHKALIRGE